MSVIGIGTDLVHIDRIRSEIERNPAFTKNVFTQAEIDWCEACFDPATRYSGRFAAKEAFYKALPTRIQNETTWLDIEILSGSNGKPEIRPSLNCNSLLRRFGVSTISVSISHENEFAIAFIIFSG
jgi:holo-[acyl-carrier protein] synthase